MKCRFKENAFGHWVLQHPVDDALGWSGARWVAMDEYGLPEGDTQVANFETKEQAERYAGKA